MDSPGLRRGHAPGFHARSWTTGDGPCSIKAMVWNVILRNRRNGSRVCSTEPKASSTTVKLDSDCRLRKASQLHSPILLISASTIEQANNQVRAYDTLKHRSYTSPCILFSLFALAGEDSMHPDGPSSSPRNLTLQAFRRSPPKSNIVACYEQNGQKRSLPLRKRKEIQELPRAAVTRLSLEDLPDRWGRCRGRSLFWLFFKRSLSLTTGSHSSTRCGPSRKSLVRRTRALARRTRNGK